MDRMPEESGDRFRVRLLDLIVVVVGAAFVLDVARRSRLAWGGGVPDLPHGIGLGVLTFGVIVGLVVAGRWARRLGRPGNRGWALAWRVAAAGGLALGMIGLAGALQAQTLPNTVPPMWSYRDGLHLRLGSFMAILGMVGLALAFAPIGSRQADGLPRPRPRLGCWPSVALAGLVGIALLMLGHGMIPYLVLIAVEMVRLAMTRVPLVQWPFLMDRLTTACLESLPGLVGCFLTAAWVDDDLRAAARDPVEARAPRSWRGTIARLATVILAASGSAYVLLASIPTLSPSLAEGLASVAEPSTVATVSLGFAALAGGFAARGAGRLATANDDRSASRAAPARGFGPWPRRVIGGVAGLACLEMTGAAIQSITRDLESRWYIPISLDGWLSPFREPARWLGVSPSGSGWDWLVDRPDDLLIAIAAAWLMARLGVLIASTDPARSSPIDAIAADRVAFGRFLGWWAGLSTAILASMPGLGLLALTLFHLLTLRLAR